MTMGRRCRRSVVGRTFLSGFTLTEVLIALILLSLLFLAAYQVIRHARMETMKGFWLQDTITDLRNGTRAITNALKKTSYPSTIVRTGTEEVVVSYKDFRRYDSTGRLREIKVKDEKDFDLLARPGLTTPNEGTTVVLRFPVCTPETDDGAYQPGKILWTDVVLRPSGNPYSVTPLGDLHLVEREDSYQTQSMPFRAFSLTKGFDDTLPIVRDKVLIRDVESVDVSVLWATELRGIAVDTDGKVDKRMRKRFLLTLRVDCSHPKDDKTRIGDQCSVTSNIDVFESGGTAALKVLSVTGKVAKVEFNGVSQDVGPNSVIGGIFRVSSVISNGIVVKTIPGNAVRTYFVSQ